MTSAILKDIPRLSDVAEIFNRREDTTNGMVRTRNPTTSKQIISVGVVLLRTATVWDDLSRQGLEPGEICDAVEELMPELPLAMRKLTGSEDLHADAFETVEVLAERLEEGMVVGHDIACPQSGALLIRKGRRLNKVTIQKLLGFEDLQPVCITTASAGVDFQTAALA